MWRVQCGGVSVRTYTYDKCNIDLVQGQYRAEYLPERRSREGRYSPVLPLYSVNYYIRITMQHINTDFVLRTSCNTAPTLALTPSLCMCHALVLTGRGEYFICPRVGPKSKSSMTASLSRLLFKPSFYSIHTY